MELRNKTQINNKKMENYLLFFEGSGFFRRVRDILGHDGGKSEYMRFHLILLLDIVIL